GKAAIEVGEQGATDGPVLSFGLPGGEAEADGPEVITQAALQSILQRELSRKRRAAHAAGIIALRLHRWVDGVYGSSDTGDWRLSHTDRSTLTDSSRTAGERQLVDGCALRGAGGGSGLRLHAESEAALQKQYRKAMKEKCSWNSHLSLTEPFSQLSC